MKQLMSMRDQAMKIQKILAQETIEVTKGNVTVRISGDQKVQSVLISGTESKEVREALNEAIHKSQEKAAQRMFELTKQEQ